MNNPTSPANVSGNAHLAQARIQHADALRQRYGSEPAQLTDAQVEDFLRGLPTAPTVAPVVQAGSTAASKR